MTTLQLALGVGIPLALAWSNFLGFHRGWRDGRRYEAAKRAAWHASRTEQL